MKTLLIAVAGAIALTAPSSAEPRHDLKLERAVKEIVARKMRLEDLRGGFAYAQAPTLVASAPDVAVKPGIVGAPPARQRVAAGLPSILVLDSAR